MPENIPKKLDHPYLATIPYNVLSDKSLTDGAKLHFGYITALCKNEGYCWATNEQLAEVQGKSKKTISGYNTELKNNGHIIIEDNRIPYKTKEDKLLWKNCKKIYVDIAFIRKEIIKKAETIVTKTLPSMDSNENVTPLSIKDKYKKSIERESLENIELKELGIDSIAINFSKKYSKEKIDIAIYNMKTAKYDNPSKYFTAILKNPDLTKNINKEDNIEKNKITAIELNKKYNEVVLQGVKIYIEVCKDYFEIIANGQMVINLRYDNKIFEELLKKPLEKIERLKD